MKPDVRLGKKFQEKIALNALVLALIYFVTPVNHNEPLVFSAYVIPQVRMKAQQVEAVLPNNTRILYGDGFNYTITQNQNAPQMKFESGDL